MHRILQLQKEINLNFNIYKTKKIFRNHSIILLLHLIKIHIRYRHNLLHSWFVRTLRTFKTERTLRTKKSKTYFYF